MSVFQDCTATLLLADFIATDAGGKLQVVGGGITVVGLLPTGASAPMYLAVVLDIPRRYAGQEFPVGIELRDLDSGTVVQVPGPSGTPDSMRIQQLAKGQPPMINGALMPDAVPCRVQLLVAFPNGLPLAAGRMYGWKVEVEGQSRPGWMTTFYVPAPVAPPVFGGPAGPAGIPGVPSI